MAALTEGQLDDLEVRVRAIGVTGLRALPGGASSLTFTGVLDGTKVVVKVAPPGVPPTLNRDVLRQARVIRALGTSEVPVPEVVHEDVGNPPDVPPFFVMSFLDGSSTEPLFDLETGAAPVDSDVMSGRLRNAARSMAGLHGVDPSAVGLGNESFVGPGEEVERWCRLLATVDPALVPGWRDVAEGLRGSVPEALPPAIVHGDFRLGNLLAVEDRITAVIDWEIWSIGDPRVDVGWFLANADPDTYRRRTSFSGATPSPDELAADYARVLGRQVPALDWFRALACFKSAATWSLIVKHDRRRNRPTPCIEDMTHDLPILLDSAARLLGAPDSQRFSTDGC